MLIAKNANIVFRKVYDSYFLINISDNYFGNKCALYEINETGMFIWNNIDNACTIDELVALLQNAIVDEVDYQILHNDVSEFIGTLAEKHFVEVRYSE